MKSAKDSVLLRILRYVADCPPIEVQASSSWRSHARKSFGYRQNKLLILSCLLVRKRGRFSYYLLSSSDNGVWNSIHRYAMCRQMMFNVLFQVANFFSLLSDLEKTYYLLSGVSRCCYKYFHGFHPISRRNELCL